MPLDNRAESEVRKRFTKIEIRANNCLVKVLERTYNSNARKGSYYSADPSKFPQETLINQYIFISSKDNSKWAHACQQIKRLFLNISQ
jgi:hypothetical protein